MRYLLSGVSLLLALACFAVAVGQRTIWAPPDTIVEQLQEAPETPVLVLGGDVLATHEGRQTITIAADGEMTAVVGRVTDVEGWIGDSDHSTIVVDGEDDEQELALDVTSGGEATVPAIAGNDMWVQEVTGEGEIQLDLDAPEDYAIAIVTDGTAPAPSDVRIDWPNDRAMPLFGPFMLAGFVLAALALLLLLLAVRRHRRHRGPQRRLSPAPSRRERREIQRGARRGLPVAPTPEASDPSSQPAIEAGSTDATVDAGTSTDPGSEAAAGTDAEAPTATTPDVDRGTARRMAARRARIVLPAALVAVALTGCGQQYWPSVEAAETSASPSGTPEPTSLEDTLPPADVTVRQFERILADTREVVAAADESLDAEAVAARLGGPQLEAREVSYRIRGTDPAIAPMTGIPDGDVRLLLPQQSEVWPRAVLAVVGWEDETQAESALMFVQETPRDNFRLVYQYRLQPGNTLTGASAEIGAPGLPPTTPLLAMSPESIALAYGDVLINGPSSQYASTFPADGDTLQTQVGYDFKQTLISAESGQNANISFAAAEDEQEPITLVADADGGAYVATSFTETTTYQPKEEGVTIRPPTGAQTILSPVAESATGLSTTYQIQALYYVPPTGADDQTIVLLGFSQSLLSVQEVQG